MNLDWAEADLPIVEELENEIMNQGLYEELITKLVTSKLEELDKDTFQIKNYLIKQKAQILSEHIGKTLDMRLL
jgi:hypothetical protein